jgi:predicted DNA-binding antitoxin AbrB/MazE fold protein
MERTVMAIYEGGVLRLLDPLDLPEHTTVQISVVPLSAPSDGWARRRHVREALAAAGLVTAEPAGATNRPLAEPEREALGRRIPAGRPLSEIIIEEREGR